ncbi:MAG: UDP-N-acetylmuramoylalanine--D-glutamate ligase [Thermotoga sp. 50_1627]|nr:MAG: UDP-N-acetylmuramoylalanine--D-glutamate ligase [Thermotoga sp. 50_64]KUK25431.1 MAG: UDP-N-acetylmuramoylalanine--D-glutamate ligase [Thermotoga sp. 50_1627]
MEVTQLLYALIGYGVSNRSLCKMLVKMGHRVFVSEAKALSEQDRRDLDEMHVEFEDNGNTECVLKADWIVVSPSVRFDHPVVSKARERTLTDLDVVLNIKKPGFIVAVTGTNGKTTTCHMFEHVLTKLGKRVIVAGNIGNPIASVRDEQLDYLVLEISSFQLFWSKNLPIDVGIILNIEPNHLDWHPSFQHYVESKLKLFTFAGKRFMHESCRRFINERWTDVVSFSTAHLVNEDQVEFRGQTYPLRNGFLKTHQNLQNLSAVLTVLESLGFEPRMVLEALEDFTPPQHRMQLVAIIDGVHFVNDSKSTSAAATIAALQNYQEGNVVLILTGRGKNESYDALVAQIKRKVKHVVVFGEITALITPLLRASNVPFRVVENMEEAVFEAFRRASRGDIVLLSPAAASFDLYANYAERGEHFVRVVESLKEGA